MSRNLQGIYLSCQGRISARTFTGALGLFLCALLGAYYIFVPIVINFSSSIKWFVLVTCIVLLTYVLLMLLIKRFHDLNYVGWYSLWMVIPPFNLFFLLYLCFKRGQIESNRFGYVNAYILPKILLLLGYPLCFFLMVTYPVLFTQKDPLVLIGQWVKIQGSPASQSQVHEKKLTVVNESKAVIFVDNQEVAVGLFIAPDRILVKGKNSRMAIEDQLAQSKDLIVTSRQKTAKIRRLIASDDLLFQTVFEVDTPIGKPTRLEEKDKAFLNMIGAFQ